MFQTIIFVRPADVKVSSKPITSCSLRSYPGHKWLNTFYLLHSQKEHFHQHNFRMGFHLGLFVGLKLYLKLKVSTNTLGRNMSLSHENWSVVSSRTETRFWSCLIFGKSQYPCETKIMSFDETSQDQSRPDLATKTVP